MWILCANLEIHQMKKQHFPCVSGRTNAALAHRTPINPEWCCELSEGLSMNSQFWPAAKSSLMGNHLFQIHLKCWLTFLAYPKLSPDQLIINTSIMSFDCWHEAVPVKHLDSWVQRWREVTVGFWRWGDAVDLSRHKGVAVLFRERIKVHNVPLSCQVHLSNTLLLTLHAGNVLEQCSVITPAWLTERRGAWCCASRNAGRQRMDV